MNYYQIIPTDYIDELIDNELYQKAGAFQNYWRLFYRYCVKENDIVKVKDEDIERFYKKYSLRTLALVFNIGKDTAGKWRSEFIDVIENFVAYWKLKKMQENDNKVEYTQKQGRHLLDSKSTKSRQEVDTDEITQITEKSNKTDDEKNSIRQRVDTYLTESRQRVDKYITYNNNINNNNKKINKEWLEEFFIALSKVSKQVYSKRVEFESLFMSLFTQYDDVEEVIEWASNNDFWIDKLIDPKSIRRNFEKMRLQMLKEKKSKPIPNGVDKVERLKDEIEALRAIYEKKLNKGVA